MYREIVSILDRVGAFYVQKRKALMDNIERLLIHEGVIEPRIPLIPMARHRHRSARTIPNRVPYVSRCPCCLASYTAKEAEARNQRCGSCRCEPEKARRATIKLVNYCNNKYPMYKHRLEE